MTDFYKYLKKQFTDLESAQKWYSEWAHGGLCNGEDHISGPGRFTLRAMAMHVSNVLEGKEDDSEYDSYILTKYGSDIYLN